jgi:hypothetical protein
MLDYGESGGYFGKFISQEYGVETIWTPHYWTSNNEKVLEFLKKQNEQQFSEIGKIMNLVRRAQGIPKEKIMLNQALLNGGVYSGFYPK